MQKKSEKSAPENIVLSAENVSKSFRIGTCDRHTFFSTLRKKLSGDTPTRTIWALKNININVASGEMLGVIGPNGAGKTTLLRVLSGIMRPTTGKITLKEEVSTMFELGIGFDPMFTATQNLYLYGALHGLSRSQVDEKMEAIIEFSQLKNYMHAKLREYSSGMRARLAFATIMQTATGIIMVDEALTVGDISFQKKCLKAFTDLMDRGCTILYVAQALGPAKDLCTNAIYLDGGIQKGFGPVDKIDRLYVEDSENNRLTGLNTRE